jgi:hypothetical protein
MVGLGFLMLLLAMIAVYFLPVKMVEKPNLFFENLAMRDCISFIWHCGWLAVGPKFGASAWIVFGL